MKNKPTNKNTLLVGFYVRCGNEHKKFTIKLAISIDIC